MTCPQCSHVFADAAPPAAPVTPVVPPASASQGVRDAITLSLTRQAADQVSILTAQAVSTVATMMQLAAQQVASNFPSDPK